MVVWEIIIKMRNNEIEFLNILDIGIIRNRIIFNVWN